MDTSAFETVEVNTDLLICGGGMAACGAAFEAAYWAKKNGLKVTVVDKAAMDRSGAVAMGLSAINEYIGIEEGEHGGVLSHGNHQVAKASRSLFVK